MSERNTLIRSMHDLGLAAWFGGTLMGAVGLNGAAAEAKDPQDGLRLALKGWTKWAPAQGAAIAMHGLGGIALIIANKSRLATQPEARTNTVVKGVLTLAALGASAAATAICVKLAKRVEEGALGVTPDVTPGATPDVTPGVTEPSPLGSEELTSAQTQLKALTWAVPALTAMLIILGAQQGEQQRPVAGVTGAKFGTYSDVLAGKIVKKMVRRGIRKGMHKGYKGMAHKGHRGHKGMMLTGMVHK